MKTEDITRQIGFVKEITLRLPNLAENIGTYGCKKYSKYRVITDIQRIRRELLELEKMIKENVW